MSTETPDLKAWHARCGGFQPPVPLPRRMWASDHEGWLTMDAVATLR